MFPATKKIYDYLSARGNLKVFTDENEKQSEVWLQFGVKNGSSYRVKFISSDNDNDVAVRVFGLVSVEENQKDKVLPVLNSLNNKYRYAKFTCHSDGDINIEYDFPMRIHNLEACAEELLIRIVKIVDESYPELMRAMWA